MNSFAEEISKQPNINGVEWLLVVILMLTYARWNKGNGDHTQLRFQQWKLIKRKLKKETIHNRNLMQK